MVTLKSPVSAHDVDICFAYSMWLFVLPCDSLSYTPTLNSVLGQTIYVNIHTYIYIHLYMFALYTIYFA